MDYMIRATAADGMIRAFAAVSRDLVEKARSLHNTSPVATAALGRTLTCAVMMGTMMKSAEDLLTVQIRGDGPLGGIVATADAKGRVKGYVQNPEVLLHANEEGKLDVGRAVGAGSLQVIMDLGMKEPYVGTIDLISGEIAEDFTYYFAVSEQVPSSVGLGVLMEKNNTVRQAGGFIIQLMPGAPDGMGDILEARLHEIQPVTTMLDEGKTPEQILESILYGMDLKITEKTDISFTCDCSKARVEKALISIGADELQAMIDEGKTVETECHFCNKHYQFTVDEIRALRDKALKKTEDPMNA